MTRELSEIISDMRNIVKPYIAKQLKQVNFEHCGSADKAEFETEFEMVLTLAEMANQVTPQEPRWIPVSERLPKELEPVNVTWIIHNPESHYADIKDKPFTATGVYFNGQWYWWSTLCTELCTDILAGYSNNYDDSIDDDIEITAWMPLPKPYEPQGSEEMKDFSEINDLVKSVER